MTQHDFHIALVLLALITAGTLGYQSLNAESANVPGYCTLALYFSSFDGCNSSDASDIQPPPFLNERLHSTTRTEQIELFEIEHNLPVDSSYRRTGWSDGLPEATQKFESGLMQDVDSFSFLVSDTHGEFIKQVKSSTARTIKYISPTSPQ